MLHKIITGSKATEIVEDLLKDEKDSRSVEISLLNLGEVNLYIDTLKAMQNDLNRTIKYGLAVMQAPINSKVNTWEVEYDNY